MIKRTRKERFFVICIFTILSLISSASTVAASSEEDLETWKAEIKKGILGIIEGKEVDIQVELDQDNFAQGKIDKLVFSGREIYSFRTILELTEILPNLKITPFVEERIDISGLKVDEVIAEFIGVQLNAEKLWTAKKVEIEDVKKVNFYLRISEEHLKEFAQDKNPHITNLDVKFYPDEAVISGTFRFLPVPVSFKVRTDFEIRDSKVYLRNFKLYTYGIKNYPVQWLILWRWNPLVNLKNSPFPVDLNEIKITERWLILASAPLADHSE